MGTLRSDQQAAAKAMLMHDTGELSAPTAFRTLAIDEARTASMAEQIVDGYQQARKILVLTERTEQLAAIEAALVGRVFYLVTLLRRSSKKQHVAALARL